MATKRYGLGTKKIVEGTINLTSDTIKVMLATNSYIPNQDTHEFADDVTNQCTNAAYAQALTLSNKSFAYDTATNKIKFDNTVDPVWSATTITNARYAIFFKDTGTEATSPIISYHDFGADKSSSSADFTLVLNAGGIFDVDVT